VTLKQIEKCFTEGVPLTSLNEPARRPRSFLAVDQSLIGPDGRANPAFILPNRTPGSFGQIFIRDRNTFTWDVDSQAFASRKERARPVAGASNFLNHPRWGIPDTNVFGTTFGVVNGPRCGAPPAA
jgi:hypothetical protein